MTYGYIGMGIGIGILFMINYMYQHKIHVFLYDITISSPHCSKELHLFLNVKRYNTNYSAIWKILMIDDRKAKHPSNIFVLFYPLWKNVKHHNQLYNRQSQVKEWPEV